MRAPPGSRRRAKNREAARKSRERKVLRIEALQRSVADLQAENELLLQCVQEISVKASGAQAEQRLLRVRAQAPPAPVRAGDWRHGRRRAGRASPAAGAVPGGPASGGAAPQRPACCQPCLHACSALRCKWAARWRCRCRPCLRMARYTKSHLPFLVSRLAHKQAARAASAHVLARRRPGTAGRDMQAWHA